MWTDLRFAVRTLMRSPGFAVLSVLTLALGIGASTAVFSLLYQVVMRSVPARDPGSLVSLGSDAFLQGWIRSDNNRAVFSYPMYKELRNRNQIFSGLFGRAGFPAILTLKGNVNRTMGEVVTGDYFQVLGLEPALGRLLLPADDSRAAPANAIVLSYSYWAGSMGADPGILNRQILMNNHPVVIVGVAQRNFHGLVSGNNVDFFAPVSMLPLLFSEWQRMDRPDSAWLNLCGRLKPGISVRQANAAILPLYRSIVADELPGWKNLSDTARKKLLAKTVSLQPAAQGLNELRDQWQTPLLVLMFMVGLVLLIACANVANLLLARSASRQKETAVRLAIGATHFQIVRQLLIESVLLSLTGGLLGVFAAKSLVTGLLAVLPADAVSGWLTDQIDPRVLLFSLALSILTGMLFGLAPSLQTARPELASTLKEQSLSLSGAAGHSRTRKLLVAAQICLSLLLLVGAGLFTRSLVNLLNTDPGFQPEHLITFSLDPVLSGYTTRRADASFLDLNRKLQRLPGAISTAISEFPPFGNTSRGTGVKLPGSSNASESVSVKENSVSSSYFHTLGIPLLQGRVFTDTDTSTSAKVAILNETLAHFLFPGVNPVGRSIKMGPKDNDIEIVGVVKDSKYNNLRETPQRFIFVPKEQAEDEFLGQATFFVRTRGDRSATVGEIRQLVKEAVPDVPVDGLTSMKILVDNSIYTDRLIAILAIAFGVLAMILAAIGLYGTISYAVTQRTREFGIRLALGADPKNICTIVFREIATLIGFGMVIGLPVSYFLARVIQSRLFGIRAHDPLVLLAAILVIVGASVLAGFLPARHAMRIEPVRALRYE